MNTLTAYCVSRETLVSPLDLLSSILSNIGYDAIGQLSITSKTMENITNK